MQTDKHKSSRNRTQSQNETGVFGNLAKSLRIFSPTTSDNVDDENDIEQQLQSQNRKLLQKLKHYESMIALMKKQIKHKDEEKVFLQKSTMDLQSKLKSEQNKARHIESCLEESQLSFARYKEETDEKL